MAITWNAPYTAAEAAKTYEGAVLKTWTDNNYRIMSDVWGSADYALVWDEEKKRPVSIVLNVWEYGRNTVQNIAVVDATDEVKQKYYDYQVALEVERLTEKAKKEAMVINKEDTVTVVAGRTAKGVTGKVVAIIQRPYGMGYRASVENKLAVATSEEKIQVAAKNGKIYENYKDVEWVWARNVSKQNIPVIDVAAIEANALANVKPL